MGRHDVIESAGVPARSDQFPNVGGRSDQIDIFDQGMDAAAMFGSSTARFLSVSESNTSSAKQL